MLTEQRYQIILQLLANQQICKINELVRLTDASESTIRRDLDELEKQGLLERIHGGARLLAHLTTDQAQTDREQLHRSEKGKIAEYVAQQYLHQQQFIFLDAGSTVQEIIPYLSECHGLTLMTNSITTAARLSELELTVNLPAGRLKNDTKALVGAPTVNDLAQYRFDLALIGTNAVAPSGDLMTPRIDEASVKKVAISHAKQTVVMTDASKFSEMAFATFGNLQQLTALVTNHIPDKIRQHYHQTNIKELTL
ncbi:DeoR/GlpR family DNA-binding transcription regulator [Lapidilactobacillus salsurivasis]